MITSLRIENFALIDAVEINFNSGFTVITGETGSGKSILLNALNLNSVTVHENQLFKSSSAIGAKLRR